VNDEIVEKPWSDVENKKAQYDCKVKNIITFALNLELQERWKIVNYRRAKSVSKMLIDKFIFENI